MPALYTPVQPVVNKRIATATGSPDGHARTADSGWISWLLDAGRWTVLDSTTTV